MLKSKFFMLLLCMNVTSDALSVSPTSPSFLDYVKIGSLTLCGLITLGCGIKWRLSKKAELKARKDNQLIESAVNTVNLCLQEHAQISDEDRDSLIDAQEICKEQAFFTEGSIKIKIKRYNQWIEKGKTDDSKLANATKQEVRECFMGLAEFQQGRYVASRYNEQVKSTKIWEVFTFLTGANLLAWSAAYAKK